MSDPYPRRYVLPPTYEALLEAGDWQPIRGCPGRLVLRGGHEATPKDLVGETVVLRRHEVPAARDPVWVAGFEGGGLISYERSDDTWVHTLNTVAGLARKLEQLGVPTP